MHAVRARYAQDGPYKSGDRSTASPAPPPQIAYITTSHTSNNQLYTMASFRFAALLLAFFAVASMAAAAASGCKRCPPKKVCAGPRKARKCVVPVGKNGRCGGSAYRVCKRGLKCAGNRKGKKCVAPLGKNKRCGGNPFKVCKRGLKCVRGRCS
eukprot:IDg23815t1